MNDDSIHPASERLEKSWNALKDAEGPGLYSDKEQTNELRALRAKLEEEKSQTFRRIQQQGQQLSSAFKHATPPDTEDSLRREIALLRQKLNLEHLKRERNALKRELENLHACSDAPSLPYCGSALGARNW